MLDYGEYLKILVGLLAIVNPLGAVPFAMTLLSGYSRQELKKTNRVVFISVIAILTTALLGGEALLHFFNISFSSFRVAGGILVLLMAMSMMHGRISSVKYTDEEQEEMEERDDSIAVVPLTMPMLTGPGAMSTVILYAHMGTGLEHYGLIFGAILVVAIASYAVYSSIPVIARFATRTSLNVTVRIMGLILAAIAIEFIAGGIKELFPRLA